MPLAFRLTLLCLVLAAGIYDVRFRRIPNWLSVSGLLLGLSLNLLFFQWPGAGNAFLGIGLALIVYIPLYCLSGMGAGDVKLMAAVGAIAGPGNWLAIFLVTALAGGLVSLAVVARKRRIAQTLWNVFYLASELLHLRRPAESLPELNVKSTSALRLPHAVPIALGCLTFLFVS